MVAQHFRWDFIGLSTDQKPTPATSEKVVDGSTFYCSDNSKLYVYCKNNWYERKPLGGGGGGTTYTAGDGIDITEGTISVDTEVIQPLLTAGTNITISDENVISASGGSAVTTLTADDYNYPISNPYAIGLGLLPAGFYKLADNNIYITRDTIVKGDSTELFYVSDESSQGWKYIWEFQTKHDIDTSTKYMITKYQAISESGDIVSNYTDSLVSSKYLQAFYGTKIDTTAPTTSTAGYIGQLYLDTTNQKAYLCFSASGGTYTWKEITLS